MDWSKVGSFLQNAGMPALGALLAPMTGGVSLAVTSGIAAMLGHPDPKNATPEQVLASLQGATPEQMAALKAEDNRHSEAMEAMKQKAVADARAADLADVQSARQREMSVKDMTTPALAWVVVLGGMSLFAGVLFYPPAAAILTNVGTAAVGGSILGYITAEVKQVLNYYFGSSRGSDRKTELIAQQGGN